jgi:hypothetical protein
VLAGTFARSGIATITINVVGHGAGPFGTYTVNRTGLPSVTLPLGGRGIDQDGNGSIDSTEGVNAAPPYTLISNRDGLPQTVIDLMQLVKVLRGGVDVDADGADDLSTSRIYYAGQSFGGMYGTQLLGLERHLRAGVLNVPGGPVIEIARLSPSFRGLVGLLLLMRTPSLYNAVPNLTLTNFHENIPLRGQPAVTATPDETAIQRQIDRSEWAQQAANPAAYAPYLTAPAIFQFARGDQTVPNPTTSAILRACGCADRATLYRHDLAFAANPALPKNPHSFLTNVASPAAAPFALAAQQQIATFFTSDGVTTVDPDGAAPFFERRPRSSRRISPSSRDVSAGRVQGLSLDTALLAGEAEDQDVPPWSSGRPDHCQRAASVVVEPRAAENCELVELREPDRAARHEPASGQEVRARAAASPFGDERADEISMPDRPGLDPLVEQVLANDLHVAGPPPRPARINAHAADLAIGDPDGGRPCACARG